VDSGQLKDEESERKSARVWNGEKEAGREIRVEFRGKRFLRGLGFWKEMKYRGGASVYTHAE
jgi:hypothetical protein